MNLISNLKKFFNDFKFVIVGILIACCFSVYADNCFISDTADNVQYGETTVQHALDEIYSRNNKVNYFATDDWDTIINNVKSGTISRYNIGDEREIELEGYGTHKLRISNMSSPDECNDSSFSTTGCGFVLEFADIITTDKINQDYACPGVWPNSEIRTFINEDIYNSLPAVLREAIIDSNAVSNANGYSSSSSTDKLYLLNMREIGYKEPIIDVDYSSSNSRALDYYVLNNDIQREKKYNDTNTDWWLRSADNDTSYPCFWFYVSYDGFYRSKNNNSNAGISPAFRIG